MGRGDDLVAQGNRPEVFLNLQLSRLVQLQQLDLKLHDREQQQQRIPRRLQVARAPVDEARKRLDELQASLDGLTTERRSGEQDLSEHEHHIGKIRERLQELKTNKEYQAHLFEIELAGKKKDALEEQILQSMERAETVSKELEDARTLVGELTGTLERETGELESLGASLATEVAALREERVALVSTLDKHIGERYTALKASLKLVVVAQVRGSTCLGCQLQIPPQLVAGVKRADQLLTCPYCYRILYAEEVFAAASASSDAPPSAVPDGVEEGMAREGGTR